MKIKELQKTVNIAWSPQQQSSIYLAAGTAAQQLDINVSSALEIYSSNLLDPGYDLELKSTQPSKYKFQKIIWSPHNIDGNNGLIVGGCEGGNLQIFDVKKLLNGQDAVVAHQSKHTGVVRGLDFNPFQNNLLASAASESEIFIWDLNNTTTPMAPGTKTQPLEDVQNISWNRQVQHILSSVFSSRCVIWDLRKNEQIMKLSDSQTRVRWRATQWHPDVATQLWLASEDDSAPYVQLWDLRYATTPAKTLQIHNRGILGLTWCPKDIDMMISCGKDNKILCWNPNSELPNGEILGEVATTIQWYSDVQWCPKNPALIASSSLEGNVSVYSLFGGTHHQVLTSNKIADSFPGMEQYTNVPDLPQTTQVAYQDLIKPPKFMKKKAGASFSFGGRLITFGDKSGNSVKLHQVVTETQLINRANELEKTLEGENFIEYCKIKADEMPNQQGRYLWYFIKANFEIDPREEMINLLGYNKDDVTNKLLLHTQSEDPLKMGGDTHNLANKLASLVHSDSSELENDQSIDESTDISAGDNNTSFDGIIQQENRFETEISDKTSQFNFPTGNHTDGLISEAILSGNIETAVDLCFKNNRSAEALIIASTAGVDFLKKIQIKYLSKQKNELSNIIYALVQNEWIYVMTKCNIDSWKEALVAALTYSDARLDNLCVKLGDRILEEVNDTNGIQNALLCYICAGHVEKFVEGWFKIRNKNNKTNRLTTSELQDVIEIIMLLKKSLEMRGKSVEITGELADILAQYASVLATQGALDTALTYLEPSEDSNLEDLRERLYYALGHKQIQKRTRTVSQSLYGRPNVAVTNANRFTQPRNSLQNNTLNQTSFYSNPTPTIPQNQFNPQSWQQQQANAPNMPPAMNNNLSQTNTFFNQSYQQSPPAPALPPPPVANKGFIPNENSSLLNPQRPPSVGSASGGSNRSRYVVDPSVASGPNYLGSYNSPAPPQPNMQFNTTPYGNQYNQNFNSSPLPSNPSMNNQNTTQYYNPNALNNTNSRLLNDGTPVPDPGHASSFPTPPIQSNPTPPPGWNDPPPISSSRKQSAKTEMPKVAPITHPIFGAVDSNQNGYMDPNMANQNNVVMGQDPLNPYPQTQQFPPRPAFNTTPLNNQNFDNQNFMQNPQIYQPPSQNNQQPPQQMRNVQEVKKEKLPIPEEYIYMQTVLEELTNKCNEMATDLRTKKKIQDVVKRLEFLYDALRERKLSLNTRNSLSQIVQYMQNGDYGNALAVHTQIVSGADFSQTANFLPGIKIILQIASELNVFLQ